MNNCPHVTLKRQNSGSFHWYICADPDCGQKFKAEQWDGKMKVIERGTPQEAQ